MAEILLPYDFEPRGYQINLLSAIDSGYKRAVGVWHRRAGKDLTLFNLTAKKAADDIGLYYYFFPTFTQGRKALWENITNQGRALLDYVPRELADRNNTEMKLTLFNGSIIRIIGTDRYDDIRGSNPRGVVFSEYSYQDPNVWSVVRPILDANNGWAAFNYTPNGDNHGKTLYELAKTRDDWFCELLTAEQTGVFTKATLQNILIELIAENGPTEGRAIFDREYMCSFDAPVSGAYYGDQMRQAESDHRIGNVPYEPELRVQTFWDLGVDDSTCIWFVQTYGREVRLIDYYESSGEGLDHYAKVLGERNYVYDRHYAPHDIRVRELTTGHSRIESAKKLGINFDIAPRISVEDGIHATRMILPRCWFDMRKCFRGISALKNYHKKYDDINKVYSNKPHHDWSSHAADAMRMVAVCLKERMDLGSLPTDDVPDYALSGRVAPGTSALASKRMTHAAPIDEDLFDNQGFLR